MPRNFVTMSCVVVWLMLGAEGRGVGVFYAGTEEKPRGIHSARDHRSVLSRSDAKPLNLEELDIYGNPNTSVSEGLNSRHSKPLQVLNTSNFNTSSLPPSHSVPSTHNLWTGKAGESNKSLHSLSQPRKAHSPLPASSFLISNAQSSLNFPSLMERAAMKELASSRNFKPVNLSTSGDFALPDWERAPRVLTTFKNYSRVLRLPSWESSLSLFGVKSHDEVRIALLPHDKDEAPINITIYGHDGHSEIRFNVSKSGQVEVSRFPLTLTLDKYTWFTLFRKEHFLSVHIAGTATPILAYEHDEKNLDLLRYTRFQVWSKKKAHWDLIGKSYKNENKGTAPVDEAMTEELRGIEEGLAERFGLIMNLVGVLQRPNVVDNLTLSDILEIKDSGESILSLRNILFYYDFINNKNMHWTSV